MVNVIFFDVCQLGDYYLQMFALWEYQSSYIRPILNSHG